MHVHRARVHGCRGGRSIDGAEQSTGAVLHHAHRSAAAAAQVGQVGGALAARPEPPARPLAQESVGDDIVDDRSRCRAEPGIEIVLDQRDLGGGGAQVRGEDVPVPRIEHAGLDVPVEDDVRVVDEVGVQRVVPGDEDAQGRRPGSAGPAELLPQARPRSRPACGDDDVETADVDAHLECVGGGEGPHAPLPQPGLQRPALLGQVPAAVGGGHVGQRRVDVEQVVADEGRGGLRAAPAAYEGQRLAALDDAVGDEVGRLAERAAPHRVTIVRRSLEHRGLPEGDGHRWVGRGVLGDGVGRRSDEA